MPEKEAVAARLKIAREHAGLSQGQVAKMLSMQRPTVTEIEAGRRKVSADEIKKFCDIYNVRVEWLLQTDAEAVDPVVELAARELAKLKKDDLDIVLNLLASIKRGK